MKADKKERELLHNAIKEWTEQGKLSEAQANELKQSIIPDEPAQLIAHYFFFIALSCVLLAFGAIFIDEKFVEKMRVYFSLSNLIIAVVFTALSTVAFIFIRRKKGTYSKAIFEVYSIIASLLALTALIYYCKEIGNGPDYTGFLAMASVMLFSLSVWLGSDALWLTGILAFMGWYGIFTTWQSANDRFLGMNYPMRYAIFGILVTALSFVQGTIKQLASTKRITYIAGLIILMTGLWGVSVFGNYNSFDEWSKVRQVQVIWYALIFAVAGVALFFYGIKNGDATTRDIGVFSLLINLYSRYFEYFWDNTNKGVFFLILAVSFWFIGKQIEKSKRIKRLSQSL